MREFSLTLYGKYSVHYFMFLILHLLFGCFSLGNCPLVKNERGVREEISGGFIKEQTIPTRPYHDEENIVNTKEL